MKRSALMTAVLLLAGACGGSGAGDTTTTTAATTTTTTTSTTIADTTTTGADDGTAGRVAAAGELAGSYEGEWNNITFGSSGSAEATIEVDGTLAIVTLVLGGNVFGVGSPDPIVFEFDLTEPPPYETTSGLFGEATVEIDGGGGLGFTAASIDSLGGMSLAVVGTVDADGFDITYTIFGPDGSLFAEGVMTMPRA